MGFITRAWRGQEACWIVFWIYGVIFLWMLDFALSKLGISPVLLLSIRIIYIIWLSVSEWRCAFNLEWRFWGYIVRIFAVLSFIGVPVMGIFAMYYQQAGNRLQECTQSMASYADKKGIDPNQYLKGHVDGFKKCLTSISISPEKYWDEIEPKSSPAVVTPPVSAPAALPPASTVTPPANQAEDSAAKAQCLKIMGDYATKNGADPAQYIAQNDAWLQNCIVTLHAAKPSP